MALLSGHNPIFSMNCCFAVFHSLDLVSAESQPRSLSKVDDLIFKSESVQPYFVVFGVSQMIFTSLSYTESANVVHSVMAHQSKILLTRPGSLANMVILFQG